MEIVITMVSLANLQMQSCRCDDVENILMVRGKSPSNHIHSNIFVVRMVVHLLNSLEYTNLE